MPELSNDLAAIIAKNVKTERLKRGMSQQKLAQLTGLSVRYISRLETEPQNLRVDKLGVIARAMNIQPERLLQPSERAVTAPRFADDLMGVIRSLQALHAEVS